MKLKNYLIVGLVGVLILFSSCADKYYETTVIEQGGNANIETRFIKTQAKDWKWYEDTKRYEVHYDIEEISPITVDYAAVIAYLLMKEGDISSAKNLPYEQEYEDKGNIYTRRIAYDIRDYQIAF